MHDATNLLLRYLLKLPETLIDADFYQRFHSILSDAISAGALDFGATVQKFQRLVKELPTLNRHLLLYLLDLMAVFAGKADDNKTTVPKLASSNISARYSVTP